MKITKLAVTGQRRQLSEVTDTSSYPALQLKDSILVAGALRGETKTPVLDVSKDDLVELVFDDDTTWLCPPDTLEDIYPGSYTKKRGDEAAFELPVELDNPDLSRGIAGKAVLKMLNLFTKKKAGVAIRDLASDLEEKQMGKHKGLVRVNRFFELEKANLLNNSGPFLLFIHGTNSSTNGSFGELLTTDLWNYIVQTYDMNILAFQHETLTKSPLQNALDLVKQLPASSELHIITHSRGGLVGEILGRFSEASGDDAGFSKKEIDFFTEEKRADEVACIEKLKAEYQKKNFKVKKFIRVACPASGTTILSKRLDHFFNISLNLIGLATGAVANPIYIATKNLLTAIIDQKNDHTVLPGLEAMKPDSPFITVLNNQASTVSISEAVVAISGNCKMKVNLKALVIIASKLFFQEDNDLVVNTKSMYNGSKRKDKLQLFFDEGTDVDHFHYFKNKKTNSAILLALKSTSVSIDGFTEHFRGKLGEAERNAVLKLDGGQYSTRVPSGNKPIAILLPGIMGSNLTKKDDLIWINYLRFLTGELKRLSINEPGIKAPSIVKTSYKKLGEMLQGEYDVVTFSFDWRLSLETMAGEFDKKIKELLRLNQPIKIIGHSMGGVLVRDFMVYHPDTWKKLNESAGFKLLFLGSPLGGSFRIINVLFGEDDIISKISKLDIVHSKKGLLGMFSQFPGLLSLLPHNTDSDNDFSNHSLWKKMAAAFGDSSWPLPSPDSLKNFKAYRDKILNSKSIDYSNAVYIAGKDKQTPCGYRIDDTIRGQELVFLSTAEGDQSVTWDTGIPSAMIDKGTAYYVDHTHGALSNAPKLFNAIKEILSKGQTDLLNRNRPSVRGDQKIFRKPETSDFDLSPEGIEKTLLGIGEEDITRANELPLKVKVSHGDLKYASYPVMAGHFKNDSILYAESRIDYLLAGLLQERHKLGLYPGDIGTSEILLNREGFPGAIIIGLDKPDKLTGFLLIRSAEQAIAKYLLIVNGREKLAGAVTFKEPIGISSLIIASGYGGLSVESSINGVLQGAINANEKIKNLYGDNAKLVSEVEFIELYEDKALNCFYTIQNMSKEGGGMLNITSSTDQFRKLTGARKQINMDAGTDWWNRITVKEEDKKGTAKGMQFSISSGTAREDFRNIFTNTAVVDQLLESISTDNNWTEEKAKAVFELMIPNDFKSQLSRHGNITWVLDKSTARFPWELLQDKTKGARPLCINAGMIRQLATADSRINIDPVSENTALVIGDPQLKGFAPQLPGALEEAKMVTQLLKDKGYDPRDLLRESEGTIIPALMSGNYKIIHLAGHGVFDADPEKKSGMVIGYNSFLTTAEIAQMSTTPELVFVNCCFLGKTDAVAEEFFRSRFKLAANIGTQLIEIGVKAVIVAGWAVDDAAALGFAKKFYDCMFSGEAFGEAVRKAREAIYQPYERKNTWGAYQCYGDPYYTLHQGGWKGKEKHYVISAQAEIDLSNLLSDLKKGEMKTEDALAKLKVITDETERRGIRTSAITELEAMVFRSLNKYEKAIEKFELLLSSPDASYSFAAAEQYCNVRAKHLAAQAGKVKKIGSLEQEFNKLISDLDALIHLSPSAERYNITASTWKRMIGIYRKNKTKTIRAIGEAARNYLMAYTKEKDDENIYPYTNWVALEVLLVIAGERKWGEAVKDKNGNDVYAIPTHADIVLNLQDMERNRLKKPADKYWDRILIPNLKLAQWMLSATADKKAKQTPDPGKLADSYVNVWKMAGTKDEKQIEIQHLDLLIEALELISPKHILYNGLKNLRGKLTTAIDKG
jgi:CHAT domain-containing protein